VPSFLETFEVTVEVCGWLAAESMICLLPLLTGEAQTAVVGLPPTARHDYAAVRKTVMDLLGLTSQDHRRERTLGPKDRTFPYAHQLNLLPPDGYSPGAQEGRRGQWRRSSWSSSWGELPARTSEWLRCSGPTSLEAAITLADDHLAVHPCGQGDSGSALAPARLMQLLTRLITARSALLPRFPNPVTSKRRHPSQPTEGLLNIRAGVLEVRAARTCLENVSADGSGPGDKGCWLSNTLPRSRIDR